MSDSTLNRFLARGTTAERTAFVPDPPTPASGPDSGYFWFDTDDNLTYSWDGANWVAPAGSGNVNAGGTLTANQLVIGAGSTDVAALGTLGTTTTVLHGNAGGAPTFGAIVSGDIQDEAVTLAKIQDATANDKLLGSGNSGAGNPYAEITIGAGLAMTGTTLSATATGGPTIIIKPSDESVNNNTLQNDDDFLLAVGANEDWIAEGVLFVTGSTSGDFQWAWTAPAGASGWNTGVRLIATAGGTTGDVAMSAIEDVTATGFRTSATAGTSTPVLVRVEAVLLNGANAGTWQFTWAQVSTDAGNPTVIQAGSYMRFTQVT